MKKQCLLILTLTLFAIPVWAEESSLRPLASKVTLLGDGVTGVLVAGAVWSADQEAGRKAFEAMAITAVATHFLKNMTGRERPYTGGTGEFYGWSPGNPDRHSFPSGHTSNAFALAHILAKEYPKYKILFYSAAALVGWSRVELGMHWPGDVVAGAALGVAGAELISRLKEPRLCFSF